MANKSHTPKHLKLGGEHFKWLAWCEQKVPGTKRGTNRTPPKKKRKKKR